MDNGPGGFGARHGEGGANEGGGRSLRARALEGGARYVGGRGLRKAGFEGGRDLESIDLGARAGMAVMGNPWDGRGLRQGP